MSSTTAGIKIDEETRERVRKLGSFRDRPPHCIMKAAIREYLEKEERWERERREDDARWDRYVETGAFIDDDDMTRWFDGLINGEAA